MGGTNVTSLTAGRYIEESYYFRFATTIDMQTRMIYLQNGSSPDSDLIV